jgi:hypothetical protein
LKSRQPSQRLTGEVERCLVEGINISIWPGDVDERRGRVDDNAKVQASILGDITLLGGSLGPHGTPRGILSPENEEEEVPISRWM